ncbi:hypothetical protein TraAM80_01016 [Trypanosoma rangeli]|uniref:Uncharacterized protein n=1 Tax=Trypanosoma rangeli TaxID=5698 RepID=A0A3R7NTG2_TRYRA|nr:uncharacterized protein TraAM80_01016 [Trypanosoma rangeli]RNF11399.1 hypothetical protein TraAM80_01016 [Trypanosoma rangeli]|eukprot:RNF11399.1 hypothetical protein TraAM80_01016 [Trypanosoma rangeli]
MIRGQCKTYCQCNYCKRPREQTGAIPGSTKPVSGNECSKDELYLRTLNDSLRARSLMASSKNAHKFKPDTMLQSTRGDMARAALTVPVRRRDRLQELLILENKGRIEAERQLRRDRRAMGLSDEEDTRLQERGVGTRDDFHDATAVAEAHASEAAPQPKCSAEGELLHVLNSIKTITDEHAADDANKPLSLDRIHQLRQLVHEQDMKAKKMVAECPLQPHVCGHCFAVNAQGKHLCQVPPPHILRDTFFPSIHGKSTRRFNYSTHPYGTGVVWVPLDEEAKEEDDKCVMPTAAEAYDVATAERRSPTVSDDDKADAAYQYPGSTHNKYLTGAKPAQEKSLKGVSPETDNGRAGLVDSGNLEKGNNNGNGAPPANGKKTPTKEPPTYKSSAALWRTTNQDRADQMQRFLEFKKLQANAARLYAETAIKRRADNGVLHAVSAGDRNGL